MVTSVTSAPRAAAPAIPEGPAPSQDEQIEQTFAMIEENLNSIAIANGIQDSPIHLDMLIGMQTIRALAYKMDEQGLAIEQIISKINEELVQLTVQVANHYGYKVIRVETREKLASFEERLSQTPFSPARSPAKVSLIASKEPSQSEKDKPSALERGVKVAGTSALGAAGGILCRAPSR